MIPADNVLPTFSENFARLRSAMPRVVTKYKVTMQWRKELDLGADPSDWRNWRTFAVIPILFPTEQAAWDYIHSVRIFRNAGRKPSASVQPVRVERYKVKK